MLCVCVAIFAYTQRRANGDVNDIEQVKENEWDTHAQTIEN